MSNPDVTDSLQTPAASTPASGSATDLRWHYGPTEADKDPGKMWCCDCGKLVMWLYDAKPHGCYICTGCSRRLVIPHE